MIACRGSTPRCTTPSSSCWRVWPAPTGSSTRRHPDGAVRGDPPGRARRYRAAAGHAPPARRRGASRRPRRPRAAGDARRPHVAGRRRRRRCAHRPPPRRQADRARARPPPPRGVHQRDRLSASGLLFLSPCRWCPWSSSAPRAESASSTSTPPAQRADHLPRQPDRRHGRQPGRRAAAAPGVRRTRTRTSRSTSTRRAARSTRGSRCTTRCSSSSRTWRRSAAAIAMSMGSLLLTGGAKGKRFSLPNSRHPDPPAVRGLRGPVDGHRDPRAGDHQDPQAGRRDLRPPHGAGRGARPRRHGARPLLQGRSRPPSTA